MRTSEQIDQLAPALIQLQGKLTNPQMSADNDFYNSKYVPLVELVKHVRGELLNFGFAVVQSCQFQAGPEFHYRTEDRQTQKQTQGKVSGAVVCMTRLIHSSGQWVESDSVVAPNKGDAQGWGGAMTYARRYGLLAALRLVGDEDDDGNYGLKDPRQQPQQRSPVQDDFTGAPWGDEADPGLGDPPAMRPAPAPQQPQRQAAPVVRENGPCPVCSGTMRRRNGRNGPFLGCSNYPNCKQTGQIA
jgi:hypothetical protein